MKRQYLMIGCLALLVFLGGCIEPDRQRLHPPAWIQGEWGITSGPNAMSYTFTATTVIQRAGYISLDYEEMFRSSDTHVTEKITGQLYSFTYLAEEGGVTAEMTLEFTRVDADNINMTLKTSGGSIGPLPLTRL